MQRSQQLLGSTSRCSGTCTPAIQQQQLLGRRSTRNRRNTLVAPRCEAGNPPPSARNPVFPTSSSSSSTSSSTTSSSTTSSSSSVAWVPPGAASHRWSWRGSSIHYVTAGCGKPVVLVHGFGASSGHYRRTIPFLAANGFKVYALDLVGFGASDKPLQNYTIELWADLIRDFTSEFCAGTPAVLVGNSIGSLSVLAAAADACDAGPPLAGVVLLNSAGAMNNKGVVADWRIILAYPLLLLIDLLLRTRPIAQALFGALATPETVSKVLAGVYVDQGAVDDDLVNNIILPPAFTPNALDVFVSVITGPAGPKPWDLLPRISSPLLIAWGDADPFTPLDGPVGQFFLQQAASRPETQFVLLDGVGHCPQDDSPEKLHSELLPWLKARWS